MVFLWAAGGLRGCLFVGELDVYFVTKSWDCVGAALIAELEEAGY